MEIVLVIIGAVAGLALGVWLGLKWGMRLMEHESWRYWMANGVVFLVGVVIAAVGQMIGHLWFSVIGLGFMGGAVTGLKYGYGHSPGVWAVHDRLMGIEEQKRDE